MRSSISLVAVIALAVGVVGCSTSDFAPPSTAFDQAGLEAVREYRTANQPFPFPTETTKPIAYVVLDDNDDGRNKEICRAFEMLQTSEAAAVFGGDNFAKTYWLLTSTEIPTGRSVKAKCKKLIENFDFVTAQRIANRARVPNLSSAYIVAWDNKTSFYINLDKGSDDETVDAMNSWFEAAAANPGEDGIKIRGWLEKRCGNGFMATYDSAVDQVDQLADGTPLDGVADIALDAVPYARVGIEVADRVCKLVWPQPTTAT